MWCPGVGLFYRHLELWEAPRTQHLQLKEPGAVASLQPTCYGRGNAAHRAEVTLSEVAQVGDSTARLRPGLESCCPARGPAPPLGRWTEGSCLLTSRVFPGEGVHLGWGLTAGGQPGSAHWNNCGANFTPS